MTTATKFSQPQQTADSIDFASESLFKKAWKRFRRHKLAMFGLVVMIVFVLTAVFAPLLSPYPPNEINLQARSEAPSAEHWFGTDRTGRDIWARTLYGGRVSLSVGLVAVSVSAILGIVIGCVSGYAGGWVDMILMRITDTVQTFPSLVIMIVLVAIVGPSIYNTMFAIGILGWPGMARIVRSEVLSLREQPFVLAARSLGIPTRSIIFRHILPNTISSLAVAITFAVASAILQEAALSFLGLGVQLPTPSWGNMLQDAQTLSVLETMPWMWVAPGVMIGGTVLCINFIGDGLRDALDPRSIL